jgi:hypothetical protein
MKNKNYLIKYNTKTLNMQIITMNQSFYIYIGDNQMLFENLLLSIPNKLNKEENKEQGLLPENISCRNLIDDEINDLSEVLCNFLVSKLKIPIFLSLNVFDPLLIKDPMFISFLQENILQILIKTNK